MQAAGKIWNIIFVRGLFLYMIFIANSTMNGIIS